MSGIRLIRSLAVAAAGVVLVACADNATAPSSSLVPPSRTVSFQRLNGGSIVSAVAWEAGKSPDKAASGVIGPDGGTISIPSADFSISFPRGALASATTITVTPNTDGYVGYDMQPHGLTFAQPVTVTLGLTRTTATEGVFCAYLPGSIGANGRATAIEIEASVTTFGLQSGRVKPVSQTWKLNHFSRYILGSGFVDDSTDTGSR